MKSAIDRRIKDARFPEVNTVDSFDFDFEFFPAFCSNFGFDFFSYF